MTTRRDRGVGIRAHNRSLRDAATTTYRRRMKSVGSTFPALLSAALPARATFREVGHQIAGSKQDEVVGVHLLCSRMPVGAIHASAS